MVGMKKITLIFLISLVCSFSFLFLAGIAPTRADPPEDVKFKPQVGIPDSKFEEGEVNMSNFEGTEAIGEYVKAIYTWAISIVGVLAATVLLIGGIIWLTAGGNTTRVETAKSWIAGSITGLVLALASYTLLYQINPDLVAFRITKIQDVANKSMEDYAKGICYVDGEKNAGCEPMSKHECEEINKKNPLNWTHAQKGTCLAVDGLKYYTDGEEDSICLVKEDCAGDHLMCSNSVFQDFGKCKTDITH